MLDRSGPVLFRLVPVSVLGTSLSEIALVHGSANHLCYSLHNLGRRASLSWPPAPDPPPLSVNGTSAGAPGGAPAGGPGLRAPPPGRYGGPEAGGPPLGRCAEASSEASGRPGPGYRSAGRGGQRLACWNRQAPGPPRGGWGSRGMRRPWDGWRGTPAPTPHRSGRARAPQALASALARAEVDGAVLVWCSLLPRLRPVLLTPLCVSGGASGYLLHPSAPDESCTWFWGRLAS